MSMSIAPRTKKRVVEHWRSEMRWLAYGYLASRATGTCSNRELAGVLGLDPRGLRQLVTADPHFRVVIRRSSDPWGGRGEPWYEINPECLHAAPPPPPEIRRLPAPVVPTEIAGALPGPETREGGEG